MNVFRNEKEMLQKYIDLSEVIIVIINKDQTVASINKKGCDLLGYDKSEIIGKKWFDNFIPERHRDNTRQVFSKVISGNIEPVKNYENSILTKNNEERIIAWKNKMLKDESGNLIGSLSSGEDITQQRKLMNELQDKEERIRLLLDSTAEAIYGIDLDSNCTFCNPSFLKLTGYDAESELLGKNIHNIIHHSKNDGANYPEEDCPIILSIKKGKRIHVDNEFFWHKDQTCFPVEYWSHPIWKNSRIIGAVVTFVDITDRKNIEAMLLDAKEAAESASRAKSTFLTGMSHELRTPLNGILGYTQILRGDSDLTDRQREGVNIIEKSGKHLLSLLNEILDLAKIESGKIELFNTRFHFISMIKGVNDMIRNRAERKGIKFKYECDSDMEMTCVYVYADEQRLSQILINLLGNAIKFTDRGRVILRVIYRTNEALTDMPLTSKIRFEIEDTGIGINPEDMQKIFDPFFQAGEQKFKAKGTGLGLTITRTMIELMDTSLQISSKAGQGSIFSFELVLPILLRKKEKSSSKQQEKIIGIKGKIPESLIPKILIIDDEKTNRSLFNDLLSPLGFKLKEAENARDGLEKAEAFMPDLIITDLIMPVMDGFEFISSIRQSPILKEKIIIASSASVYKEHQQKSFRAGADDFIGKPIDAEELMKQLKRLLNLEWEYENTEHENTNEPEEMILPPEEIMYNLYKMTELGDIIKIRKQLEELEKSENDYKVFTKKLRPLVEGFRIEDIGNMMKKYLKAAF